MVIYEFQRECEDGEWEALGLSRGTSEEIDLVEAVGALRATRRLEPGSYRVRAVEDEHRWHFAEVDTAGTFRLVDEPPQRLRDRGGADRPTPLYAPIDSGREPGPQ